MFETLVAADIGSAFIRIAAGGRFISDESRAALDPMDRRRVLAVGEAAGRLLNASEAYPVGECISDIELTALILRRLALNALGRRSLFGMSLMIALPAGSKQIERDAAFAVSRAAGFRRTAAVEGGLAGAVGAGLDIFSHAASMTVDIGRSGVRMLTFANGGAIASCRAGFGSAAFSRSIAAWLAEEKGIAVGERAAERLKLSYGEGNTHAEGSGLSSGRSQRIPVSRGELEEAMRPAFRRLVTAVSSAINELPPEAAADLLDTGITLTGGGAKLYGLPEALEDALGVPVRAAKDPENAVIRGMRALMRSGRVLEAAKVC